MSTDFTINTARHILVPTELFLMYIASRSFLSEKKTRRQSLGGFVIRVKNIF